MVVAANNNAFVAFNFSVKSADAVKLADIASLAVDMVDLKATPVCYAAEFTTVRRLVGTNVVAQLSVTICVCNLFAPFALINRRRSSFRASLSRQHFRPHRVQ